VNDLNYITRKFLLGESHNPPSMRSYVQSLSEILRNLNPKSQTEKRRVEIALEHVREIKRHTRKLEERVMMLEEKLKVLEEDKK
jgi:ubiquinone biosynthesis protein UbiJ